MTTAAGASSLFGLVVDGKSDRFSVGHPGLDTVALAKPDSAPASAAGSSGTLTGSFLWRYSFGKVDGTLTDPSPTSTPALVLSAKKASLSSVDVSTGSDCTHRVIERSADGGTTWAICGYIWDNTTTTFTDDYASLDTAKRLPSVNQTGANMGFSFLDPDSFDLDVAFSMLRSQGLSGSTGQRRGVPGPIKLDGSPKGDFKTADLLPILLAGAGDATVTPHASEPTVVTTLSASVAKRTPRTVTAFLYKGSSAIPPAMVTGIGCEELTISFSGGKIIDKQLKLQGASFTRSGAGVPSVGNTGTYTGTWVALGLRGDAKRETDDVHIKITQGLSGGTFKFKTKVGTLTAYGATEYTGYYNTTSFKQTKGGAQFGDGVELCDETGARLGFDVGSNRMPYVLLATGPLTGIAVDDEWYIPRSIDIPGSGTSPYTGIPPVFAQGPVFTDAHVTITQGGTVVEAMSGSLKFTWPKPEKRGLGADARTMRDRATGGFHLVNLTVTRYLDDTTWQDLLDVDQTASVVVTFEGPPIEIQPGVYSPHRHSFVATIPAMEVQSIKSPVANQSDVQETAELQAVQPSDSAVELYSLALTTDRGWRVPA